MPYLIDQNEGGEYCVYKQNPDGSAGDEMKCYPSKGEADKYMAALYSAMSGEASRDGVYFTDLAKELAHLSKIDGLAALDDAVDAHGRKLSVKPEDLPAYVENTKAVLESTRDSQGNIVGLPIDLRNHDHQGGAAWIVGLELDKARNVIQFVLNWTEAGIELVQKNISRYFSASFDDVNKIILGGSLTNWPASVNKRGEMLLRPVELSKSLTIQENKNMTVDTGVPETKTLLEALAALPGRIVEAMSPKKPDAPVVSELSNATITELLATPQALQELGKQAEAKAAEMARASLRQKHVVEFASTVVGGTPSRPIGLGVRSDEIVELLLSLPEKQSLAVEKLLGKFLDSVISFAELGYGGDGFVKKPHLPAEYREAMQVWVDGGKPAAEFFRDVMPELGKAEDFNLTEFNKEG
jgi:hypothetical protein